MAQFEPYKDKIENAGTLAFMAAEKHDRTYKNPVQHFRENPIPFLYLLDEDRSVSKQYGVYTRFDLQSINIAKPATFIVGREGMITFAYVGGRTDRAPLEQVIAAFEETAKKDQERL
jgi:peroxiredoxin